MEKASPTADLLPPPDPAATVRLGLIGAGAVAAASVVGLADGGPGIVGTVRLLLTGIGCLLAGVAVSKRPDRWATWALLAGAAALAGLASLASGAANLAAWAELPWLTWLPSALRAVGRLAALPPHWDSAALLGSMIAVVAGSFAVTMALPPFLRPAAATVWIGFHFLGILGATTWPSPTPWVTQQGMSRVFAPYLHAVYLRNAYHFYSPEPGPASLLHLLVRYELDEADPATGKSQTASEWVVFPKRDRHMKDPLGLSYYRRLSLTEAASQSLADAATADTFNRTDATQARGQVAITGFSRPGPDGKPEQVVIPVPPAEFEPLHTQYRVPDPLVSRNLLPSYARHLVHELSGPGRRVVNVKMYRLEHRVVPPEWFVGTSRTPRLDPFHPTTYRAYFLGDYGPAGELVNPRDPLLYWLIPVLPKPGGAAPGDKDKIDYDDYLSKHAGFEVDWRRP